MPLKLISEFQGGITLYQGPQESYAQEPQLYVAWKTKLSSALSLALSSALTFQPSVLSPQFSVQFSVGSQDGSQFSPLKGGDAGVAKMSQLFAR